MTLAEIARSHGAGRFAITDTIIPEIGFEILPSKGDYISANDVWLVFIIMKTSLMYIQQLVYSLFVSDEPVDNISRLIRVIDG